MSKTNSKTAPTVATVDESELAALVRAFLKMDSYPTPIDFSQARFVRVPHLWLVLFEHHKIERSALTSEHGVNGPLASAFSEALEDLFPDSTRGERKELVLRFRSFGLQYLALKGNIGDLLSTLGPQIKDTERLILHLERTRMQRTLGENAAEVFALTAENLDPDLHHPSHAAAIRKATNAISPASTPQKRARSSTPRSPGARTEQKCRMCGEIVVGGFRVHNNTCPKRDKRSK